MQIERLDAFAFRVPTEEPEADGTLCWDATGVVVVEVRAGGRTGLGWSYTDPAAAPLVRDTLAPVVVGRDAMGVRGAWDAMRRTVRNIGRDGVVASAISAVDVALWDLKARALDVSVADLLGRVRDTVPIYGSGGFTSYSIQRLQEQLGGWVEQGIPRVKMKVGPKDTLERVRAAREAIGERAELFTDANGAWSRKQALWYAERMAEHRVSWLEEPVTSDDLPGLRLLRDQGPPGMAIAAGEYGWDLPWFVRCLEAEAVDVMQADVTRCHGITGFLAVHALCDARSIPLSAHTAPTIHAHLGCALPRVVHVEQFHDHERIEQRFFEGAPRPEQGALRPWGPGLGVAFKRVDAERFAV